jgi:hypothetical protein
MEAITKKNCVGSKYHSFIVGIIGILSGLSIQLNWLAYLDLLCQSHLNEGGVLYYNTTGSLDVIRTTLEVFPYVVRYGSFVAGGDQPFDLTTEERKMNLLRFIEDGKPVFSPEKIETTKMLDTLSQVSLPDVRSSFIDNTDLLIITDDNMATEYKLKRIYDPSRRWSSFWNRWLKAQEKTLA